jgi:hypothetical protein
MSRPVGSAAVDVSRMQYTLSTASNIGCSCNIIETKKKKGKYTCEEYKY